MGTYGVAHAPVRLREVTRAALGADDDGGPNNLAWYSVQSPHVSRPRVGLYVDEAAGGPQPGCRCTRHLKSIVDQEERVADQAQGGRELAQLVLGVLKTFFFVRHVLRDRRLAEEVDHSAGDRVRSEVAVAHLVFGVLGLLSMRFRGAFWSTTVIGQAIFLIGFSSGPRAGLTGERLVVAKHLHDH